MNSGFIFPRGLLLGLWSILEMSDLGALISMAIYQLLVAVAIFGIVGLIPSDPLALGVAVNTFKRPPQKPPDKSKPFDFWSIVFCAAITFTIGFASTQNQH